MSSDAYDTAVEDLRRFFDRHCPEAVRLETDLLEERIIDSLLVMDLAVHLERSFGIRLDVNDIVPARFRSIATLAQLVANKLNDQVP
jgi:acyl carrier protein